MIEQTGSIFIECEKGYYHPSIFSDIIIRDKYLNVCGLNERDNSSELSFTNKLSWAQYPYRRYGRVKVKMDVNVEEKVNISQ